MAIRTAYVDHDGVTAAKGKMSGVVADLADEHARAQVLPEAIDILGGSVDILVNNAVAGIAVPVAEASPRLESVSTQWGQGWR